MPRALRDVYAGQMRASGHGPGKPLLDGGLDGHPRRTHGRFSFAGRQLVDVPAGSTVHQEGDERAYEPAFERHPRPGALSA